MNSVCFENIRSLKNTGDIPILPITILVGQNSSGKSTFLRMFPLLKQSLQKKTNGPILWAGDVDDYVDFGSFKETITNDNSEELMLSFSFSINPYSSFFSYYWLINGFYSNRNDFTINYKLFITDKNDKDTVSKLYLSINETSFQMIDINSPKGKIMLDGESLEYDVKKIKTDDSLNTYYRGYMDSRSIFGLTFPPLATFIIDEILNCIKSAEDSFIKKNMSLNSAFLASIMFIGEALIVKEPLSSIKETIKEAIEKDDGLPKDSLNNTAQFMDEFLNEINRLEEKEKQRLFMLSKLYFSFMSVTPIEEYIQSYFLHTHYIAPVRATAERYYRLRNSAIDEVDYQGKNLAIFLNSLSENKMSEFRKWTSEYFGFEISVNKIEGHLSLTVKLNEQSEFINLSDTGFGYSQILPIITQLWEISSQKHSSVDRGTKIPVVVAIEQPELHLHPAMQAKLAESFIACISLAKKNNLSLQIIIETHSETIVNYFGRAISKNEISSSDVAVILFERNHKSFQSEVTTSYFDDDGFLEKWPIGFFTPEE